MVTWGNGLLSSLSLGWAQAKATVVILDGSHPAGSILLVTQCRKLESSSNISFSCRSLASRPWPSLGSLKMRLPKPTRPAATASSCSRTWPEVPRSSSDSASSSPGGRSTSSSDTSLSSLSGLPSWKSCPSESAPGKLATCSVLSVPSTIGPSSTSSAASLTIVSTVSPGLPLELPWLEVTCDVLRDVRPLLPGMVIFRVFLAPRFAAAAPAPIESPLVVSTRASILEDCQLKTLRISAASLPISSLRAQRSIWCWQRSTSYFVLRFSISSAWCLMQCSWSSTTSPSLVKWSRKRFNLWRTVSFKLSVCTLSAINSWPCDRRSDSAFAFGARVSMSSCSEVFVLLSCVRTSPVALSILRIISLESSRCLPKSSVSTESRLTAFSRSVRSGAVALTTKFIMPCCCLDICGLPWALASGTASKSSVIRSTAPAVNSFIRNSTASTSRAKLSSPARACSLRLLSSSSFLSTPTLTSWKAPSSFWRTSRCI
mmetsp:Transcript_155026/g.496948  ORF Transcript_155026/g.496948 Transcript_155026/m.496948 type:complete len:487 (+) Transcript_155026:363-1823(+)